MSKNYGAWNNLPIEKQAQWAKFILGGKVDNNFLNEKLQIDNEESITIREFIATAYMMMCVPDK